MVSTGLPNLFLSWAFHCSDTQPLHRFRPEHEAIEEEKKTDSEGAFKKGHSSVTIKMSD